MMTFEQAPAPAIGRAVKAATASNAGPVLRAASTPPARRYAPVVRRSFVRLRRSAR